MEVSALYAELEPALLPILKSAARSYAPTLGLGVDDALQEARVALYHALQHYDYNRSRGGLYSYARRAVRNALYGLAVQANTQGRVQHAEIVNEVGETRQVRVRPSLLGDFEWAGDSTGQGPAEMAAETEMAARLRRLKMRLVNGLGAREREIFNLLVHPPDTFSTFLRNVGAEEPTNELMGRFLGLSKNSVDWSIHKTKRKMVEIMEEEFSDVVAMAVKEGRWPMIHASLSEQDVCFLSSTLEERELDPRPSSPRSIQACGDARREVEEYHWGSVLFLKLGDSRATVVCEGRVNLNSGEVHGESGFWKRLQDHVPWYPDLVRALRGAP